MSEDIYATSKVEASCCLARALLLVIASLAGAPCVGLNQEDCSELKDTLLVRETRYLIRVPNDWNGIQVD